MLRVGRNELNFYLKTLNIYHKFTHMLHGIHHYPAAGVIMNLVKKITNLTSLNTEVQNNDGNQDTRY